MINIYVSPEIQIYLIPQGDIILTSNLKNNGDGSGVQEDFEDLLGSLQ